MTIEHGLHSEQLDLVTARAAVPIRPRKPVYYPCTCVAGAQQKSKHTMLGENGCNPKQGQGKESCAGSLAAVKQIAGRAVMTQQLSTSRVPTRA